jgi:O-methyltransferase
MIDFMDVYNSMKDHTIMCVDSISLLWKEAQARAFLPGDAVEMGVYCGGSASVLCRALPNKTVYLFDTFKGFPAEKLISEELNSAVYPGRFEPKCGCTSVDDYLKGKAINNFVVCKGVFPESLNQVKEFQLNKIMFAHIDFDLYQSTLDALNYVYPRMVRGGTIVIDDYDAPTCVGVKKAVDEFFATKESYLSFIKQGHQCQCIVKGFN